MLTYQTLTEGLYNTAVGKSFLVKGIEYIKMNEALLMRKDTGTYFMDTRKSDAIYEILLQKGFAESLCREIAYKYMNTDYTATRMLGYLYRMIELKEEQLVDEMIAILEDRDRIIKKHEMEQAQAAINRIYNEGLE